MQEVKGANEELDAFLPLVFHDLRAPRFDPKSLL
jgi:hypothetical protein